MILGAARDCSGECFVAKAITSSVTRWMTKAIVREMRALRATQVRPELQGTPPRARKGVSG